MSGLYRVVMACLVGALLFALPPADAFAADKTPEKEQAEEKEEAVAVKDLPTAVLDMVKSLYADGEILSAEKETETKRGKVRTEYEVTVKLKSGTTAEVEMKVTSSGRIGKVEVEEVVALKDLPKTVVAAVETVCPGGKIMWAQKETEKKKAKIEVEYEIKVRLEDKKMAEVEVEMTADGRVKAVEVKDDEDAYSPTARLRLQEPESSR